MAIEEQKPQATQEEIEAAKAKAKAEEEARKKAEAERIAAEKKRMAEKANAILNAPAESEQGEQGGAVYGQELPQTPPAQTESGSGQGQAPANTTQSAPVSPPLPDGEAEVEPATPTEKKEEKGWLDQLGELAKNLGVPILEVLNAAALGQQGKGMEGSAQWKRFEREAAAAAAEQERLQREADRELTRQLEASRQSWQAGQSEAERKAARENLLLELENRRKLQEAQLAAQQAQALTGNPYARLPNETPEQYAKRLAAMSGFMPQGGGQAPAGQGQGQAPSQPVAPGQQNYTSVGVPQGQRQQYPGTGGR